MEYFKRIFLSQLERLKNVREGSDLYFIFFRLQQIGAVVAFFGILPILRVLPAPDADLPWLVPTTGLFTFLLVMIAVSLVLCEVGLRCLDKNQSAGLYLGLLFSLKCFWGWGFMLGLFGFYAFLNPSSQQKYLGNAPQWFRDLLTFCKINYIEKPAA